MKLRHFVVAIVLGATVLAGCGGDDGGTTDTGAQSGGTGTGTGTGGGGTPSEKCINASSAMAAAVAAVPQAMTGGAKNLEQSIKELEAFANAAPSEIRDDLKTVAAGYAKFAKALSDAGYDPSSGKPPSAAAIAAITAASAALDDSKFQDAVERVDAWFEKECS